MFQQYRMCSNCMAGYMINGICNKCGRPDENPAERPPDALPNGWMLQGGRYCLGRVLGSGGFGITYLAWDYNTGRRVAIKEYYFKAVVNRDKSTGWIQPNGQSEEYYEHLRQRFMDEAHILNNLREYKNIVNVYHLFEENNTTYYTMDYLEGRNLQSYFKHKYPDRNTAMTWEELAPIVAEVIDELNVIHSRGLFHRDISPDNIFMLNGGKVRLIDFGSVRNYTVNSHFTTIYKESFAPFEFQYVNGNQGPWSDIFSLCVTMYYLLTHKLPKNAVERMANWKLNNYDPVTPISSICNDLPANVASAIERGMSLNVENRQQNVMELRNDLFPDGFVPGGEIGGQTNISVKRYLVGINSKFNGTAITISGDKIVRIGRGFESDKGVNLEVVYPADYTIISRKHCSLTIMNGNLYIRDDNSTNGVYIRGNKISPNQWYLLNKGDNVYLANKDGFRVE